MTIGEAGAGPAAAAEDPAAQWLLKERLLVDAGHLVKTVEVY